MAAYCHFWRIPPSEYWELGQDELEAMDRFMQKWVAAQEKANRGG